MRRLPAVLALLVMACGGDDAHKQPTLPHLAAPVAATEPTDGAVLADATATAAPTGDAGAPALTNPPAPLSEDMARSYFQSGDAALGAAAFAREAWADAEKAFTRARAKATGIDAARLDLMIGLAMANQRNWGPASAKLAAASKDVPVLADFISYQRARALFFTKKTAEAKQLAMVVDPTSIVGDDATLLVGDIVRGEGKPEITAAHYAAYLARRPNGRRMSETRFRIAEANEQLGKKPDAIALYREIATKDPLSGWAKKAMDRLAVLAPDNKWTAQDHITRGMELFDAMRNPESEAAFVAALADPAITPADKCIAAYHAAQSRFKARDRKGAAPLFDASAIACKAAANVDLEIKSHYQAGRSYAFIGEHKVAIAKYKAAEAVDPKHSYADDALLRQAEEHADLNDDKGVLEALSALPTKYPQGDNVAEAMWRLGWRAWRAKKLDDAIKWWKKQIELVPHDDNYYGEGQPQYWLGRAYLAKGNKAAALESWEQGVLQYPAAYYALQGLNRIRDTDPTRYEKVVATLTETPAGYDPSAPAFTFKPRPEWGSPGFLRAMEFTRLGLGDEAQQELKRAGLAAPTHKKRVEDPDQVEKLWAIAYLLDRAGRYQFSHWPTRFGILDYRKSWPTGANRARWLIAYPKAYWELLSKHATINKLPVTMQIAIVREESAFNPTTESYANAWGLTQMIPPTAKQYAVGTGVVPTRENMFDPENNVTVGSKFLGSLFATYKNYTLLVPPAYNAGPGAVRRMLRARGTWDADEFIEGIVDDQARNYSKRVLGTFFTYSWLYEGSVPAMPLQIPPALLPKS